MSSTESSAVTQEHECENRVVHVGEVASGSTHLKIATCAMKVGQATLYVRFGTVKFQTEND